MLTPLRSAFGLFNVSRRIMWSCFSCHCTAPPLPRPTTSCSRDGTILTNMRSNNKRLSCDTRVLSPTGKTVHSCLVEHGKTGDPRNQFLTDGVLLGSSLQDWIHIPFLTLHFWPPGANNPRALVTPQTPMSLSLPTPMVSTRQGNREASLECEVSALRD